MNSEENSERPLAVGRALQQTAWLVAVPLFFSAWVLVGIEAATIVLAVLIGGFAFVKPQTGLWASTGFLVFVCVFFPSDQPQLRADLPSQFVYWGAGVGIIAGSLFLAWLRRERQPLSDSPRIRRRLDRMMLLMLTVFLLASVYGALRGNGAFPVARQLFGCLLFPGYYLLTRTFLRTPDDVDHWLRRMYFVVTAGSACWAGKLIALSIAYGGYVQERSQFIFFAGAIATALFFELLSKQERLKAKGLLAVAFVVCALAVLFMGGRFAAASLAATLLVMLVLRRKRHRLLTAGVVFGIPFLAAGMVLANWSSLSGSGGIVGELAERFSPVDFTEDLSYVGRVAQFYAVMQIVRANPAIGNGMGGEVSFVAPEYADLIIGDSTYVDNGWGYILAKMGVTGLLVFLALIGAFFWSATKGWPREIPDPVARLQGCLLAMFIFGILAFMGGPTFFQFTQSGLMGGTLGALAVLTSTAKRGQES